jgi:hypothetical protein
MYIHFPGRETTHSKGGGVGRVAQEDRPTKAVLERYITAMLIQAQTHHLRRRLHQLLTDATPVRVPNGNRGRAWCLTPAIRPRALRITVRVTRDGQ